MRAGLDRESPVPLYHQIFETLRYDIATGRLGPGDELPSVRRAAKRFEVNMHTVRRAYAALVEAGLAETHGRRGTRVLAGAVSSESERRTVERFVSEMLATARKEHGLDRHSLVQLLLEDGAARPIVFVVECSENQCAAHAREIEARWHVDARPWCLSNKGAPKGGTLIATLFHYNEIRRRWPERVDEIQFVPIRPAAALYESVSGLVADGRRKRLIVCEREEAAALDIAADLSRLFPKDEFFIETRVVERAVDALRPRRGVTLFAPRIWADLPESARREAHVFEIRYEIDPDVLDALGRRLGWAPTHGQSPPAILPA